MTVPEVRRLLCRLVWTPSLPVDLVLAWSRWDGDIRPEPSVVIINAASNFWHHMCDCSIRACLQSFED